MDLTEDELRRKSFIVYHFYRLMSIYDHSEYYKKMESYFDGLPRNTIQNHGLISILYAFAMMASAVIVIDFPNSVTLPIRALLGCIFLFPFFAITVTLFLSLIFGLMRFFVNKERIEERASQEVISYARVTEEEDKKFFDGGEPFWFTKFDNGIPKSSGYVIPVVVETED